MSKFNLSFKFKCYNSYLAIVLLHDYHIWKKYERLGNQVFHWWAVDTRAHSAIWTRFEHAQNNTCHVLEHVNVYINIEICIEWKLEIYGA